MLTFAHLHLGIGEGDAFAVVGRAYLIFIGLQWRHAGVLVAHLVEVGGDHLPGALGCLALHAAQHGEVVDGVAVGVPRQQNAALAGLCYQRILNLAVACVVEVGQVGIGVDVGHGGFGCRGSDRHKDVVLLFPSVGEIAFYLSDGPCLNQLEDAHLGNDFAIDKLPVFTAQVLYHRFR